MNMSQPYRAMNPQRGTRRTVVIPAFNFDAPSWSGVSEICGRFTLQLPNDFSLKLPVVQPSNSFVAAVSWTLDGITFRFKLADLGVLYYPVYNGERMNKDIYLEIWSVYDEPLAESLSSWVIETSGLVLPTIKTDISDNYESVTATEV